MDTQQIADYLEKYNLKTKEQLASHIEELKRNTKPNLSLISELVWALEDDSSFFNSFCAKNNKYKETFTPSFVFNMPTRGRLIKYNPPQKSKTTDFYEACENTLKNIALNNHISEVINDEQQERRSAEHIDEVLEEIEKSTCETANQKLTDWLNNFSGEKELFDKSLLVEWQNYKPNPTKEFKGREENSDTFFKDVEKIAPFYNVNKITEKDIKNSAKEDKTEEEIQIVISFPDGSKIQTKGFKNVDEAKERLKIGGWHSYTIYKGKDLVACGSNGSLNSAEKESKTEENKGMSTRHKAHSEKQVIENSEGVNEGVKETEGKLFYELDFEFIKQMAERMQSNKDNSKYNLWNWKKPMTPKGLEDLKQAMWRHIIAVMLGEFEDDGREFGHLEAISNNAMMINYQLKNNL